MVVLLQLVKPGLRGDEAGHWADLTASVAAIQPAPSGYLLTLGGNGIAEVDLNNAERLATVLATMRAGLTRLVTTLRAVAPGSVVVVLTPIPRQEMSAFHTAAFVRASAMFGDHYHRLAIIIIIRRRYNDVVTHHYITSNIHSSQ